MDNWFTKVIQLILDNHLLSRKAVIALGTIGAIYYNSLEGGGYGGVGGDLYGLVSCIVQDVIVACVGITAIVIQGRLDKDA